MSVGSVTNSFMTMNNSSMRSSQQDMAVVTVMLVNLAMELDKGNMEIVPMFEKFGQQLVDFGIGPTGDFN